MLPGTESSLELCRRPSGWSSGLRGRGSHFSGNWGCSGSNSPETESETDPAATINCTRQSTRRRSRSRLSWSNSIQYKLLSSSSSLATGSLVRCSTSMRRTNFGRRAHGQDGHRRVPRCGPTNRSLTSRFWPSQDRIIINESRKIRSDFLGFGVTLWTAGGARSMSARASTSSSSTSTNAGNISRISSAIAGRRSMYSCTLGRSPRRYRSANSSASSSNRP